MHFTPSSNIQTTITISYHAIKPPKTKKFEGADWFIVTNVPIDTFKAELTWLGAERKRVGRHNKK